MTMNRWRRQLFILFVVFILAFMVLCCQFAIRTGFASFPNLYSSGLGDGGPVVVLDVTLLRLAAEQLGKEEERVEVERLLHRNPGRNGRQRSFLSSDHEDSRSNVPMPFPSTSPQFYRLWQEFQVHLNDWWRKRYRFEPDILSDLVRLVKVPVDAEFRRYSSCAVVGNSGILLNSEHGALIDSHEAVIRLNNARIVGFERNVGLKTNISFVNSNILHLCATREWCSCNPYSENVPIIIMYICQPIHLMDYTVCSGGGAAAAAGYINNSNNRSLMVTDPRFDELCARIVKYYSLKRFVEKTNSKKAVAEEWGAAHDGPLFHYSSGLQAVMLAVGICEKVSIFGFGKSASAKHHYHTNQVSELHLHDYEAEYSIYQDLVKRPQVIPFISHHKFKFPPVVIYK